MVPQDSLTRLVCVSGPTASGKSALAAALARALGGEIVNADSRQFYREMNVGTAKPSPEERAAAPHHLIDCTGLDRPWSVGDFVREAGNRIGEIAARGKIPIVCGGTGLYLRRLVEGLDDVPEVPDALRASLRLRLEREGLAALYGELRERDAESAASLEPGDTQRVLRHLEVLIHTGRPLRSYWIKNTPSRFDALKLGLDWDRENLYERIDARVNAMLASGLEGEARGLFERHPGNAVLLKTIGYAEWHETGFSDPGRAADLIRGNSRRFAKRQLTWFRRETGMTWIPCAPGRDPVTEAVGLAFRWLEKGRLAP